MKKIIPFSLLLLFTFPGFSQLLSRTPDFIQESTTPVVITMDATKGNHGLLNYTPTSDVYVHIGVITNKSISSTNWLHVKFNQNFNQTNPALQATYLGNNKWQFTIQGGLRNWKVANEADLNYYELQRSQDGQNFSTIATINAAGNSNYSFADILNSSSSPVLYYRLKSVDKDDDFKLSVIVKIKTNAGQKFAEVNPNPFKDNLTVNSESPS